MGVWPKGSVWSKVGVWLKVVSSWLNFAIGRVEWAEIRQRVKLAELIDCPVRQKCSASRKLTEAFSAVRIVDFGRWASVF